MVAGRPSPASSRTRPGHASGAWVEQSGHPECRSVDLPLPEPHQRDAGARDRRLASSTAATPAPAPRSAVTLQPREQDGFQDARHRRSFRPRSGTRGPPWQQGPCCAWRSRRQRGAHASPDNEFNHLTFGFCVDLRGRFVCDEDGRVGSQRKGKGGPSALAAPPESSEGSAFARSARPADASTCRERPDQLERAISSDSRTFSSTVRCSKRLPDCWSARCAQT